MKKRWRGFFNVGHLRTFNITMNILTLQEENFKCTKFIRLWNAFLMKKPISISVTNVWEMLTGRSVETVNSKCEGRKGDLAATVAVVRGADRESQLQRGDKGTHDRRPSNSC